MLNTLISTLLTGAHFKHACGDISLIETHISWVILTGDYAYKIKKPVNFGFLDFTTLAQRKRYCEAELQLNQRSAPELYCGLVPISGSAEIPLLNDASAPFEYAICMKQFEAGQLFTELGTERALSNDMVDELAEKVASFHAEVECAGSDSRFGQPEQVYAPMRQNFEQIDELLGGELIRAFCQTHHKVAKLDALGQQLKQLAAWTESSYQRFVPELIQRQAQGWVRNCHGDMHLGNITLFSGSVTLFDCIEFNEDFRWIDVISDIAFLVMDFEVSGLPHLGNRFINHYLETSGDYEGLKLLSFYKVYRAMVRAKIALLTLIDPHANDDTRLQMLKSCQDYVNLAETYTHLPNRLVLTMHGISGTGKSTVSQRLVDHLGAIRVRSDVERKRLFAFDPHAHPDEAMAAKMYSDEVTHQTYERLAQLCQVVLDSGLSVIVDATNLKAWQRQCIQDVADSRGVPLCIAYCKASMTVIKAWLKKRMQEDHDASDANLDVARKQILTRDELSAQEQQHTFVIHADIDEETQALVGKLKQRFL